MEKIELSEGIRVLLSIAMLGLSCGSLEICFQDHLGILRRHPGPPISLKMASLLRASLSLQHCLSVRILFI